jgi:hypothetical protein
MMIQHHGEGLKGQATVNFEYIITKFIIFLEVEPISLQTFDQYRYCRTKLRL